MPNRNSTPVPAALGLLTRLSKGRPRSILMKMQCDTGFGRCACGYHRRSQADFFLNENQRQNNVTGTAACKGHSERTARHCGCICHGLL